METSGNTETGLQLDLLTCSPEAFLASQPVQPGSDEARTMTAGSGLKLLALSNRSGHLSAFSRTLLASLLSTEAWTSRACLLSWKPWAIGSARRWSFQLVPSAPITDGTGFGLLPTLVCPNGGRVMKPEDALAKGKTDKGKRQVPLDAALGWLLPTLTARDYRHPGDIERQTKRRNVTKFSHPLPLFLRVKLTPIFCELFMGYPANHTAPPESAPSAMPSSRKSRIKSSKPSHGT